MAVNHDALFLGMKACVPQLASGMWETVEAAEAGLAAMNPLGMASQPEDTAHAFIYLASCEARFVTGASIYHDGAIGLRY